MDSKMLNNASSNSAKGWRKYSEYTCKVDPEDSDKAKDIKFWSVARPHMRAFYCCFWGSFNACFLWQAVAPLLPEIRTSLNLTKEEVWTSSIASAAGTLLMRLVIGPLSDSFGPRILFALVLIGTAIATACTGLVNTAIGLAVLRFFIGFAGGNTVLYQSWMNSMFTEETIGTATSLITGWGNLASGLAQLWVGSVLFPLFKLVLHGDVETAWRTVSIVPAAGTVFTCFLLYASEDTPKGTYRELKQHGITTGSSAIVSLCDGAKNRNTWLLFLQNACATGVELTLYNGVVLFFKDEFGQATESAAALASIIGWMAVTCALSGFLSDKANSYWGLRGRLWLQALILAGEGSLLLLLAWTRHLGGAIAVLTVVAAFVQAAQGTTYSLVPYVAPRSTGSVSGIVSAGGNIGAIVFGIFFRQLEYEQAFALVGICVLASSLLTALISIDTSSKKMIKDISANRVDMMYASRMTELESSLNLDDESNEDVEFDICLCLSESSLDDHEGDEISV